MEASSGNSLLVACDDKATLEAALSFLDNCDVEPLTGPNQACDLEPTSLADISDFLDCVDIPQVSSDISDDYAPVRPIKAVSAPSQEKRRRTTRKQEIAQLRAQERELACRLELLRLQAYGQKQRGGDGKNGNVLPFWKKIASRQYQSRRDSEMENRRLRSLVAMHVGRAKRLKIAWKKQMATEGYQDESEQIVNEIVPFDTPAVLAKLVREADGVYAALEAFTAGVRPQRRDLIPFLEHSVYLAIRPSLSCFCDVARSGDALQSSRGTYEDICRV